MSGVFRSVVPRRGFLARLVAGAAALTAGRSVAVASEVPPPTGLPPARGAWDDSWATRLTAKHKQVFDSPEIAEATALHQARTYLKDYAEMYGITDADMNAVIVFRHRGIVMVLDDAMWDRLEIGKKEKLDDPTTGKTTRRNPFINAKPDDKHALIWPDGGLDTLIARGATVLACNLALMQMTERVAKLEHISDEEAKALLRRSLVPGVTLMPSGIFAVTRAEEAGCNYMRAT